MPSDPSPLGAIGAYAVHLPAHGLATTAFGDAGAPGRQARTVAAHDEDAVTLAVAAGLPLADEIAGAASLLLATSEPPYLDKGSAATVHAALELPATVSAADLVGLRAGASALALALRGGGAVVAADLRTPAPGVPDELAHGDAAVAFAPARDGQPVAATVLAHVAATEELMERWRAPGEAHPTVWDERFTAGVLGAAAAAAATAALERAGVERPDHVVVASANPRAAAAARKALGGDGQDAALERLTGNTGAAHLALLLADALDRAAAGETILALSGADGADAFVVRAEAASPGAGRRGPSAREQAAALSWVTYDRFLRWRGLLEISGAKRPDPAPPAAPPALRTRDWKFGLVAAKCTACGAVTTPPGRACASCGAVDAAEPVSLRDKPARVVSFTVDHLTPTPAPPLILAIVDVEGGGRRSVQVTDAPAEGIRVGDTLLPTFRRLSSTDGIHNYFWKARPEAA